MKTSNLHRPAAALLMLALASAGLLAVGCSDDVGHTKTTTKTTTDTPTEKTTTTTKHEKTTTIDPN